MRCPICVERGERSTVTPGPFFEYAMGWTPYYDEDGEYHTHDPNRGQAYYNCSLNHTFALEYRPCQSCDWGREEPWQRDACLACGHVNHDGYKCSATIWTKTEWGGTGTGCRCGHTGEPAE